MDEQTDAPLQADQEEEKQNPSDNLTPDHPRFKEVIAEKNELKQTVGELKQELNELKESISSRQNNTGNDDLTDEEKVALEKIDKQLRSRGYVTQAEIESNNRVNKLANDFERLSDKYDGKNGYPKFVAEDVVAYAKRRGISEMEDAYALMHKPAITLVEAKKLNSTQVPGSERPTGGERSTPESDMTPDKIANMSDEEYEKNRDKILSSLKLGNFK